MSERARMITCYETESWEEAYLRERLPALPMQAVGAVLSPENLELAREAEILCVFIHSHVTAHVIAQLPSLRAVVTRSTGYDHIDLAACRERGIVVSNVPTYGENTVAEHTFGLILALSRKIHQAYVRTARGDFSLEGLRGIDLKGRTLGVLGTGNIGLHVIRIARGFGMD